MPRDEANDLQGDRPTTAPVPPRIAWPAVIGVLSLVLAGTELARTLIQSLPWARSTWWHLIEILPSMVLLAGGILLVRRHLAPGAIVHKAYAFAKITLIVLFLLLASPDRLALPSDPRARRVETIRCAAQVALALAYPVFLIAWFSRPSIKRQCKPETDRTQ